MFDLWAPEHSVLREKVIEHAFLAELSRTLLLDLAMPFEILRAEFDANGYDVVIEAGGLLRHVQLKAMKDTGKRAHVDVQLSLTEKPGGCVVWMFVDPQTLALGPFLWFGGKAGQPLPPLGDREVRHAKGDATGAKKVRSGLRRLRKGQFTRVDTVGDLAMMMFGTAKSGHDQVLTDYLGAKSVRLDSHVIDQASDWESSDRLAYLVDGYELAEVAGLGDAYALADQMRAEAEASGGWSGSALELWTALFVEHRRDRQRSEGAIGLDIELPQPPLLDELVQILTAKLARLA